VPLHRLAVVGEQPAHRGGDTDAHPAQRDQYERGVHHPNTRLLWSGATRGPSPRVPMYPWPRQTALVDLIDGREAKVGSSTVRRILPTRGHRTVGAWCFLDHLGPITVTEDDGIDIGPHPHMGLQT